MNRLTLALLVLSVLSIACVSSYAAIAAPTTPTVVAIPTVVEPTTTPEPAYTVTAWTVYIRSISGERVGFKVRGDVVQCELAGEWCVLPDDTRIWAGCLAPNPQGLGCKEK